MQMCQTIWSIDMNITSSFFILLRDEYTPEVIEHNKAVINTFTEFVVIDERNDVLRGMFPAEKAVDMMIADLSEDNNKPAGIPDKIEIKEKK